MPKADQALIERVIRQTCDDLMAAAREGRVQEILIKRPGIEVPSDSGWVERQPLPLRVFTITVEDKQP